MLSAGDAFRPIERIADRALPMVKSGGFVSGMAAVLEIPEATVAGSFRVLRESGLMTSGARGVNAPDMTDLDAARLLIALLVSERPAFAEISARDFGQLILVDYEPNDTWAAEGVSKSDAARGRRMTKDFHLAARGLPAEHAFEAAVTEVIRMHGEDRNKPYWKRSQWSIPGRQLFDPMVRIEVEPNALRATISMNGNIHIYGDRLVDRRADDEETLEEIVEGLEASDAYDLKASRYKTPIKSIRSIGGDYFNQIADLIRGGSI